MLVIQNFREIDALYSHNGIFFTENETKLDVRLCSRKLWHSVFLVQKRLMNIEKLIFDADTCTDFLGNIKRNREKVALNFFKVRRNWRCILSKLLAYLRVPRNWMSALLFCNFAFKSYNTGTSRFGSKLKMNWHCHLFRNKTPRRLTQFAILVNVRKTLLVLIHLSLSVMFETGTCMYVVQRFYDDSHHPKRYFCTGSSFVVAKIWM